MLVFLTRDVQLLYFTAKLWQSAFYFRVWKFVVEFFCTLIPSVLYLSLDRNAFWEHFVKGVLPRRLTPKHTTVFLKGSPPISFFAFGFGSVVSHGFLTLPCVLQLECLIAACDDKGPNTSEYCDVSYLFTIFQLRLRSFLNRKPRNVLANLNDDINTDLFWRKMWTNGFPTDSICNLPFHTLSPLAFFTFPPYSYQLGNLWLRHSSHPERSVKLYCLLGCFLVRLHKALFS